MKDKKSNASVSVDNIYKLDGRVPVAKAIPFGLQHVLAMFVANLAPIAIICAAAGFDEAMTASLIQNAMIVAGIGTFVQLFAIWRIGSKLPIVMGTDAGVLGIYISVLTLLGGGFAVLNFFLLGLTVQKMAGDPNEKKGKLVLQLSYSLRMLATLAVVVLRKAGVLFVGGYGDSAAVPAAYHSCNADPGHVQTAQK